MNDSDRKKPARKKGEMNGTNLQGKPKLGRQGEGGGTRNPTWRQKVPDFLDALSKNGNVTRACLASGLNRIQAYRLRETDPGFAELWDEAARIGAHALEDEARRRAYEGIIKPLFYQGRRVTDVVIDGETGEVVEEVPVEVREYSDTLLIFLLKGLFPDRYREHGRQGLDDEPAVTPPAKLDLRRLTSDQVEQLRSLAIAATRAEEDDDAADRT